MAWTGKEADHQTTDLPEETVTTVMHLAGGIVKTTRVTTTRKTMTIVTRLVIPLDLRTDENLGNHGRA